MIWLWAIPAGWAVLLVVRGLRRRPRATYAPLPPVTDTVQGMADRTRGQRLSDYPPSPGYDYDTPYGWATVCWRCGVALRDDLCYPAEPICDPCYEAVTGGDAA